MEIRGKEGWRVEGVGGGGERGESIASAAPGSQLVGTVCTEPLNTLGYTLRVGLIVLSDSKTSEIHECA